MMALRYAETSVTTYPAAQTTTIVIQIWDYIGELYEDVSKIFRTGAAIYTTVVVARNTGVGRTIMSSDSVCQVSRSWVDVGRFHTRLVLRFVLFTASVRNILDTPL
jgi:hypothetical protein